MNTTSQPVTVLGAGAWGAVLAGHLAHQGHHVTAWDPAAQVIERLTATRGHPKLPGFELPASVQLTNDLASAFDPTPRWVVVVAPSHALRGLARDCEGLALDGDAPWILCSKGIEEDTLLPMAGVVEDVRGAAWRNRLAVLSGPSFAAEVGVGKPATLCAAAAIPEVAEGVQYLVMSETLRVYTQSDMLGVELGGSLKNVIAIAAGVCDGMGLGDNARAALITRGLAEMIRLGTAMGARAETFAGLAGMGDLILTCAGTLSRNHQFGELLAEGLSTQEALDKIGMTVEGMRTAHSARALAVEHGVEMPITEEVHRIIYGGKRPGQALHDLMTREAKSETP